MSISSKRYGAAAEAAALGYLESRGFTLVTTNATTRYGEVDLLMRDGPELVGVEVKARRGAGTGYPAEAVTARKLRHLTDTMQELLAVYGHQGPWRIDVVAFESDRVEHLVNVTLG